MLAAFPERDSGDVEERFGAYMTAIEGTPFVVLREAERRVLKGEISDFDPRFMPTPPQLGKLCRAIAAEMRWAERQSGPSFAALIAPFEAPPDPAVVAKIDEVVAGLAKAVDIERHETRGEWLKRMGDRVTLREANP